VVLEVRDTGKGIAQDRLPHIFDRFRRGEGVDPGERGGLGIGLSLVRHLVELHGGSVRAESAGEGQGALFTVRMPGLGERAGAIAQPPVGAGTEAPVGAGGLEGVRILIVDDDLDARDVLGAMLRHGGAEVRLVQSVEEALECLAADLPDVVLTDIGMPNATGYDLLRQIRATPRTARLPVGAVTAYSRLADRERALAAGFTFHLGKPVEPAALVRAVAMVIAGRAPSDAASGLAA
jgi:CheY-like chemotaxis protein